jgi:hypothetical protein
VPRDHTVTLAELLTRHTPGCQPPRVDREVLAQVHCHQHAVLGRVAEAGLLADGFSCRTQIHELDSGGREAIHLAELLAYAAQLPAEHPERHQRGDSGQA